MKYLVKIVNQDMETFEINSSTAMDAAKKAASMASVELAAGCRAQVDIVVEWNHRTVSQSGDDIFGGLLKQDPFDTCDREYFWWDENGIVPQNDIGRYEDQ